MSLPLPCFGVPSGSGAGHRVGRWLWLGCMALTAALSSFGARSDAEAVPDKAPTVYRLQIEGTIDLGLAPQVRRALEDARAAGAAALILEINTLGGRVDAALQIRDALLDTDVPTIAFVHRRAISAGALIALACDRIMIAGASTIGAAQPVLAGAPGGLPQSVSEKTVSFLRKEFRATAEARGRPPLIAEAMVDADVAIEGLIEKGKLLTLTTTQALDQGIAESRADTLDEVLVSASLKGASVQDVLANWAESVVRILTHPVISSLLMTVGLVGIVTEIRTPGFGGPGLLGAGSLALFFWGHWLVQLAGWEELLLIAGGLLLILLEVFVIPGFGLAGVLGLTALFVGLGASLVGDTAQWSDWISAAWQVAIALLIAIIFIALLMRWLPRVRFARRLVLNEEMCAASGYASPPEAEHQLLGQSGVSVTPLHPAGLARLGTQRIDVVSEGAFIEAGEPITVVRVDSNRVVVRALNETSPASPS